MTPPMNPDAIDLAAPSWIPERDLTDPKRPVASSTAVVGGDQASGRVDFFTRWEPNSYCSFHAHLAETISVVMAGELNVENLDGSKKRRTVGDYTCTPTGRRHYECAGPEGALLFFSLTSKDGAAFEIIGRDGASQGVVTVADMLAGELGLQEVG